MTPLAYDADNPFKAVIIDSQQLPEDTAEFQTRLQHSLIHWQAQGLRLVWLQIPTEKASLIPIATDQGFTFHHCKAKYLTLTYPLAPNVTIPGDATHFIGVGGIVLNQQQELLVIVENDAHRSGQSERYKIPGGALHAGEHIADGAKREVHEETGIQTRFQDLVLFRHWHGYRYGRSDIYFVCRLTPLTHTITKQDSEIHDARWMPVQEFLTLETASIFHRRIVQSALNANNSGLTPGHPPEFNQDPTTREIFLATNH